MLQLITRLGIKIEELQEPLRHQQDKRLWKHTTNGQFTVKSACEAIRDQNVEPPWHKFLWSANVHPRTSPIGWKILQKGLYMDDVLTSKKVALASQCCFCKKEAKSFDHLFFNCSLTKRFWELVTSWFCDNKEIKKVFDMMGVCKDRCTLVRGLWKVCTIIGIVSI
ncbi:hypothetical protein IFM89_022439 [Coptis chinensis]|uniref:Reverse transcriptase zinc-binding domain-containing protein n=1 Tax=Coptis chinensis TaxID=261450 RepID=A0A835I0R8_9MAGN|nr:hypothetical protein IFM89_022439 [Coptis chinensis]